MRTEQDCKKYSFQNSCSIINFIQKFSSHNINFPDHLVTNILTLFRIKQLVYSNRIKRYITRRIISFMTLHFHLQFDFFLRKYKTKN